MIGLRPHKIQWWCISALFVEQLDIRVRTIASFTWKEMALAYCEAVESDLE